MFAGIFYSLSETFPGIHTTMVDSKAHNIGNNHGTFIFQSLWNQPTWQAWYSYKVWFPDFKIYEILWEDFLPLSE